MGLFNFFFGSSNVLGTPFHDFVISTSGDDSIGTWSGRDFVISGKGDDSISPGSYGTFPLIDDNDFVIAGDGNDFVQSGDDQDFVFGGKGEDSIAGGEGNDFLFGGDDNDFIRADEGNDFIFGGNGNDIIFGDQGADIITGGSGADSFYYEHINESNAFASDLIKDFEQGVDVIDVSFLSPWGINDFSDVTVSNNGANTIIEANNSNFEIELAGVYNITGSDFVF